MSHRHALRTIAVGAVALLLPLTAALPAAAAPATPAAELSPALLSAMQRDLGLTAAEAEQQVGREQAAARTDESLRARLGSAHGGSHVDSAGTLVVRTTDPAAAPVIRAAGAQPVVQPAGRDPVKSKEKLDRSAKKAAATVTSWYVEEQTGKVVVQATDPAAAEAFVAQSQARADAEVEVQQVAEAPRPFADLVGGAAIYASNGGRCSIGFSARSGTTAYVVTAGHCTEIGGTWSGSNRTSIGPVAGTSFPGDDYGIIRVSNTTGWTPTPQVAGTSSVLGSTAAAVGASTCRSGSTTGYRCGTIQAKNATVNYGGGDIVYGLTRTSACAEPGDSGGSYVAGRQAQGMTSGGSGNCTFGGTTFFQPLNEALSRYGLTLVTG
jgi:streptogrisin C